MIILALGHRKEVGKDTVARFLVSHLRVEKKIKNIVKIGFADKVKEVAFSLYSWADLQPGEYYETESGLKLKNIVLPKIGMSPREIWIKIGNGIRLHCYEKTWVDYVFNFYKCEVLIIKDMRFLSEADGVKSRQGICVKINKPGSPMDTDGADQALPDSPLKTLENYVDWNFIMENDGSLNDLHAKTIELINRIF